VHASRARARVCTRWGRNRVVHMHMHNAPCTRRAAYCHDAYCHEEEKNVSASIMRPHPAQIARIG